VPEGVLERVRELQVSKLEGLLSTKLFADCGLLLPRGIGEDELLNEPPFTFTLDDSEIKELTTERDKAGRILAVAATFYGPPPPAQDKSSNEDFALSAIIKESGGDDWAFAAVADGVSSKTFWAARTSRIACLIAFKIFRQFIDVSEDIFDDATLENLQKSLVLNLREELKRDKLSLLEYRSVVPSNWSAEMYESHKERDELWYNSTLLVTGLGPRAGLIVYAGDGGIELLKVSKAIKSKLATVDLKEVLRSTEDMTIDNFVSLGVSSQDFRAARITYDDNTIGVEVILGSDGVDRTLQMNSARVTYQHLRLDSSIIADNQLRGLLRLPKCETDNFSIARAARYSDRVKRVPRSGSYIDKTKKTDVTIVPQEPTEYPQQTPPPAKRKFDKYIILPFIIGCCVGAGSALGAMYFRGDYSSVRKNTPVSTGQTDHPADKTPPNSTGQNVNGSLESVPENENKQLAEAKRAAAREAAAHRKQAEAKKPRPKTTETQLPKPQPTAKPASSKPQASREPS
jgi:hypothetical protein